MEKHFTISNFPKEHDYIEETKKLIANEFANELSVLKEIDKVDIKSPFGYLSFKEEYGKKSSLCDVGD